MKIRKATLNDIEGIINIFLYAKNMMIKHNNQKQWAGEFYLSEEMLSEEIQRGEIYVVENPLRNILSIFSLVNHNSIFENSALNWLNNEPYLEIGRYANAPFETHREISNIEIVKLVLDFCETKTKNLRVDTGVNNKAVQYILLRNGFKFIGELKEPFREYGDFGDFYCYHKVIK